MSGKEIKYGGQGFPLLTLALMVGLVMRYAVAPGTTWAGINVHYAGGILIVVSLIPLVFILGLLGIVLALVAFVKIADGRRRRRARKFREARLGR